MNGSANFIEYGDYYPYTDKNEWTTIATHKSRCLKIKQTRFLQSARAGVW